MFPFVARPVGNVIVIFPNSIVSGTDILNDKSLKASPIEVEKAYMLEKSDIKELLLILGKA